MEEEKEGQKKVENTPVKWYRGWARGSGIALVLIILFMVIVPRVIKRTIERKTLAAINNTLVHPIEFSGASLTFFRHFPDMTMSFQDLKIKGSNENFDEYFAEIPSFTLKINWLAALLAENIEVNGIILEQPVVKLLVDEKGIPNYNIIRKKDSPKDGNFKERLAAGDVLLKVTLFSLNDAEFFVDDISRDFNLHLGGVNYRGKGQNVGQELVIKSETSLKEVDMVVKGFAYFNNNQLRSEHLTIFKEDEVTLLLQKNEGFFNDLRFNFRGELNFLANGFGIDLDLNTDASDLGTLFTSLPEPIANWYREKEVDIQGEAAFSMKIEGMSIKEENKQPDLECRLQWANGSMSPNKVKAPIEDIELDLTLMVPGLDVEKTRIELDTINLRRGDYYLKGHALVQQQQKETYIKGDFDTQMNLEDLTQALALDSISLKGKLYSKMHVEGIYDTINNKYPEMDGQLRVEQGELLTQHYPKPIENIELVMDFYHDQADPKSAKLKVSPASFRFEGEDFTMNAEVEDLTNLKFDMNCSGVLNLSGLKRVFGSDDLDIGGMASIDMMVRGTQEAIEKKQFEKIYSRGSLILENITLESAYLEHPVALENGTFSFDRGQLIFDHFKGRYARTNFVMNGELRHFLKHFIYPEERVQGRFAFEADQLYLEDLIVKPEENLEVRKGKSGIVMEANLGDSLTVGVLDIPDYLDVTMDFKTGNLYMENLHLTDLSGLTAVVEGGIFAKEVSFTMAGAAIGMDLVYKDFGAKRAFFEYDIRVKEFDIQRGYNEVDVFKTFAPGAKNASGVVGLNYRLSGVLDEDMKIIFPSVLGGGVLQLKNVRVKNHDILSEISEKTGNKELKDAELQQIEIHTKIAHNVMDIERFKFRVRPFRLRFEGQTSLDNHVNLKMRLGLPPLGILGIPIKMTGQKPDIKVRLGKKTKKLDETFFDEDGVTDIRLAKYMAFRDSITAGMSIGEVQKLKDRIKKTPAEAFRPPGRKVPRSIPKNKR